MQSQFTSAEESLLSELKCPVCTEYMRPPITLCVNGHNICNICKPKVPHCPTCRQQFLNTRNVSLENLARQANYPCKYRKYGCRELYNLDLIGDHEDKCEYIPQRCLVHKLNLGICTWNGIASDMKIHLKQAHVNLCVDICGRGSFLISGVTPSAKYSKVIFVYSDVFYICSEIHNGVLYVVMQYTGLAEDADNYQYKVEFFNKERTESISLTHLAVSYDDDLGEVRSSGQCVKLYPQQFNRFTDEKGKLTFLMEIIRAGNNCP